MISLTEKIIEFLRDQTGRQIITVVACVAALMPLWLVAAFLFSKTLVYLPNTIQQAVYYSLAVTFYLAMCMAEASRRRILRRQDSFPYIGVGLFSVVTLSVAIAILFFANRFIPVPLHAVVVVVFGKALVCMCAYEFLFYLIRNKS